jgi:hypothetical protein
LYDVNVLFDPEWTSEDETIFEVLVDNSGEVDETLCWEVVDEVSWTCVEKDVAPAPPSAARKQRYAKTSCILIDLSSSVQGPYIARREVISTQRDETRAGYSVLRASTRPGYLSTTALQIFEPRTAFFFFFFCLTIV